MGLVVKRILTIRAPQEYTQCCYGASQSDRDQVESSIARADVAIFTRPGCPYCDEALRILHKELRREAGRFNSPVESSTDAASGLEQTSTDKLASPASEQVNVCVVEVDKSNFGLDAALREAAGTMPVSFPWIFIKGRHVGGLTELQAVLQAENTLQGRLAAERVAHTYDSYLPEPSWLAPAGTVGTACEPCPVLLQTRIYANVIRAYSAIHVVLFLSLSFVYYQTYFVGLLTMDLVLAILFGPVPFAPLGLLSTLLVWKQRGSHVTAIPFKVVLGAYVLGCVGAILDNHDSGSDTTKGIFAYSAFNSALLMVFRW